MNSRGIQSEAIAGAGGQFDLIRDGELVFSKRETGRFPEHGEVLAALTA